MRLPVTLVKLTLHSHPFLVYLNTNIKIKAHEKDQNIDIFYLIKQVVENLIKKTVTTYRVVVADNQKIH